MEQIPGKIAVSAHRAIKDNSMDLDCEQTKL